MISNPLAPFAQEEYVLLTTFRRTGEPVRTPVWVAAEGDRLLITTAPGSGKVKRLRHTERIELMPCDMRGRVRDGAVPLSALATVHDDEVTLGALDGALKAKYGAKYAAIRAAQKLKGKAGRSVAVVVRAVVSEDE